MYILHIQPPVNYCSLDEVRCWSFTKLTTCSRLSGSICRSAVLWFISVCCICVHCASHASCVWWAYSTSSDTTFFVWCVKIFTCFRPAKTLWNHCIGWLFLYCCILFVGCCKFVVSTGAVDCLRLHCDLLCVVLLALMRLCCSWYLEYSVVVQNWSDNDTCMLCHICSRRMLVGRILQPLQWSFSFCRANVCCRYCMQIWTRG